MLENAGEIAIASPIPLRVQNPRSPIGDNYYRFAGDVAGAREAEIPQYWRFTDAAIADLHERRGTSRPPRAMPPLARFSSSYIGVSFEVTGLVGMRVEDKPSRRYGYRAILELVERGG